MRIRTLVKIVLFIIALTISSHVITYGKFPVSDIDQQKQTIEFSDNQKEPIPKLFTGEKAELIEQNLEAIFVPCSVIVRKRAEKALVELVSTYKLPEKDSVEVDRTWSSPLNFASPGSRRAIVVFLHAGTGHYVSIRILCEFENGIKCLFFEGSAKDCGLWQICKDLDGDENPEIIIKHFVGDYDGAFTIAVWPAIYRWDGNNYVRADDEFPYYYAQEVVPQYNKILEEVVPKFQQTLRGRKNTEKLTQNIYEKCKFVLEKAESIVKKAGS